MASPHATHDATRGSIRRYGPWGLAALAGVVAVLLLLRLSCSRTPDPVPTPEPQADALLVPAEMPQKFGLRGDEVIAHCRDKIAGRTYPGILRGAYGALWTGCGNVWDKTLLAAAALEAEGTSALIVPGDPPQLAVEKDGTWRLVRLDADESKTVDERPETAVAPAELEKRHPEWFHRFEPVLRLRTAAGKSVDVPAAGVETVAEWLYQPVVLAAQQGAQGLHYSLQVFGRNGARTVLEAKSLKGVEKAELKLTWRFGKQARTWTRELFDRANAAAETPGHAAPRAGDRYAIAVALGPLDPEVLSTRAEMLQRDNSYTPLNDEISRNLIQMGTRYFIDSDEQTKKLADKTQVEVTSDTPRIAIAAYEPTRDKLKKTDPAGFSMDVLSNDVEAVGERAKEFQVARGFTNDMIESHVLFQATKLPVVSASTVFSNLRSAAPEKPERRIALIRNEATRLLSEEPIGTRVKLTGFLPRHASASALREDRPASLFVERSSEGLILHGLNATPQAADRKAAARQTHPPYVWQESGRVAFGNKATELAVVADAMLAHQKKCHDYHLKFKLLRALSWKPIPLTTGCVVRYRVKHTAGGKEHRYTINVPVLLQDGRAGGKWLTIPAGKDWVSVSSDNAGDVRGAWPEVVGLVKGKGPTMEAFLASESIRGEGRQRSFKLNLGTRQVTIAATEIQLDSRKRRLIEVKSGRKWMPALFVRNDGLIGRRSGRYEVRLLGSDASSTKRVAGKEWRWLDAREVQVDGAWTWANALEEKDGKTRIQICGSEKNPQWVDNGKLRAVRVAEARRDGKWRPAGILKQNDEKKYQVHFSGLVDAADAWLKQDEVRIPGRDVPGDGKAILLDAHRFPLVLAWKRGNTTVVLDRITPVVTGRVTDRRTGLPVAGAVVARSDGKWSVKTAADGAFGIPVDDPIRPMSQVVGSLARKVKHPSYRDNKTFNILVLADRSSLTENGAKANGKTTEQRWQDRAAGSLDNLLTTLARPRQRFGGDRVRIGLWAFGAAGNTNAGKDQPKAATSPVTEEVKFPGSKSTVLNKLKSLSGRGEPALSSAFTRVARQYHAGTLPKDLIVVLLTTGRNSESTAATEVYRKWKCAFPVHVFEIPAGTSLKPSQAIRDLALTSGGTCLTLPTAKDGTSSKLVSVKLWVTADGYARTGIVMPMGDAGKRQVEVSLRSACPCHRKKGGPTDLIVVTNKNTGGLTKCRGLSPKAKRMIEERVKDGRWTVTIPNHRVNVAGITAYAWYETETATGRMIGRTEDGLHGAVPSPRWPDYLPRIGSNQPFVAWYQGIVAYTAGSVLSAMRWHETPGFPGTADDFKHFVQANALEFAVEWWGEVASQFPGMGNHYWAGVCLNFTLQSKALGMPSDACARRWAEDLCSRLLNEAKDKTVDELKDLLKGKFESEWASFTHLAGERIADELLRQFESRWDEGVEVACSDVVDAVFGKP